MMQIETYFPTSIGFEDNLLLDKLDEYKTYCEELTDGIARGTPFTNSMLITTYTQGSIHLDPRFKDLAQTAVTLGELYARTLGYNYKLGIGNMWVNKIEAHDYHSYHTHATGGQSLISGVFYVAAPKNAALTFASPYANTYTPVEQTELSPFNFKATDVPCIPGRMVLFKANYMHGYDSHYSDEIKYSIPFNLRVED